MIYNSSIFIFCTILNQKITNLQLVFNDALTSGSWSKVDNRPFNTIDEQWPLLCVLLIKFLVNILYTIEVKFEVLVSQSVKVWRLQPFGKEIILLIGLWERISVIAAEKITKRRLLNK
jgi:hypothetical protein